jgi:hypothetical protein
MSKSFFITGVQRSGTTLLSVLLSNHPEVEIDGFATAFRLISCFKNYEKVLPLNFLEDENEVLKWKIEKDYKGRLADFLDYENLEKYDSVKDLIEASIRHRLEKKKKIIWGDKSPNLQHYTAEILELIPEAKFIHIIRDGRATAYSHASRAHKNILIAAQEWVKGNTAAFVNQQILGNKQHLTIKYENLLAFPEETARKICSFLELEFHTSMLEMSNGDEEKSYVKSTFDTSKINAFKTQIPSETLQKIENIQAPLLQKMGYDIIHPETLKTAKPLGVFKWIWLHQKDSFKMLFRSKRMGMINRKNVEIPISFRNRWSKFVLNLAHDFLPKEIYFNLLDKVNNKHKRFR